MQSILQNRQVVASRDLQSFFERAIDKAMQHQGVKADPSTVDYVAAMLSRFTRSERLYEHTQRGAKAPVLAYLYGQAVEAQSREERSAFMQRLGDVALFLSGVFAESFQRRVVDVDYCIAMGSSAYDYLAHHGTSSAVGAPRRHVFSQLTDNFSAFVDVLNEICEKTAGRSDRDVLRLYEHWLRHGSRRAANQLRALGIEVSAPATSRAWH